MRTVTLDDLVYEDDGSYTLDGVPFTGIGCDYFGDGRVSSEIQFVDGHQEGPSREWYDDGTLKSEGPYLGDGVHGDLTEWYPNGRVKEHSRCEFGICIECKTWNEAGELTKHFQLQPTDSAYQLLQRKRHIWGQDIKRSGHSED